MTKKRMLGALLLMGFFGFWFCLPTHAGIVEDSTIYQKIYYKGVLTCYETNENEGGLVDSVSLSNFNGTVSSLVPSSETPVMIVSGDVSSRNATPTYGTMSCDTLLGKKTQVTLPTTRESDPAERETILQNAFYEDTGGAASGGQAASDRCMRYSYTKHTVYDDSGKGSQTEDYFTPTICVDENNTIFAKSLGDEYDKYTYVTNYNTVTSTGTNKLVTFESTNGGKKLKISASNCGNGDADWCDGKEQRELEMGENEDVASFFARVGNELADVLGDNLDSSAFHRGSDSLQDGKSDAQYYMSCGSFEVNKSGDGIVCTESAGDASRYNASFSDINDLDKQFKRMTPNDDSKKNELIERYSGGDYSLDSIAFEDSEIYALYYYYLGSVYGVDSMECFEEPTADMNPEDDSVRYQIRLWDKNAKAYNSNCYIRVKNKNSHESVNGVDSDGTFGAVLTLDEMIEAMNNLQNTTKPDLGQYISRDGTEQIDTSCEGSGAASNIGYIPCQILEWASNSATSLYDDYVKPSLYVQPELFTQATDQNATQSATKDAWEVFRNFANIVCIILLLVVIFSQLTGVGINNYGIKKILPKLIAAAVLVNMSFFICQACVDVSNIVGNSIQGLFTNLSSQFTTPNRIEVMNTETGEKAIANISGKNNEELDELNNPALATGNYEEETNSGGLGGTITAVLILAGLFAVIGVIANPAILLTLFIGALGVLASILFLFVLLAARKAIIVVLTITSPVFFICYMLPNTRKLMEKWLKLWSAMLLLFPVCGLLVGGGNYASELLLAVGLADNGGFFGAFTSMIVGIIPIFFIPTMLKKSFTVLDNATDGKIGFGARMAGLGGQLSGAVKRRARNSEFNKNAQRIGAQHAVKFRAGYSERNHRLNAFGNLKSRIAKKNIPIIGGVMMASQAANVAQAQKIDRQNQASESVATRALRDYEVRKGVYKDMEASEIAKMQFNDALANGNESLEATIDAIVSSGTLRDKDIAAMLRQAINEGKINNSGGMYERLMKKYGNGFLATDLELKHFMMHGGTENGGKLGDFGDYARNVEFSTEELRPEDLGRLSGGSLAGMLASGKVSVDMVKEALATNKNLSEDKLIMMNAFAEGKVDIDKLKQKEISYSDKTKKSGIEAFKDEAEMLMKDHNATGTIVINGTDGKMVQRWVEPSPFEVEVKEDSTDGSWRARQYMMGVDENDMHDEWSREQGLNDSNGESVADTLRDEWRRRHGSDDSNGESVADTLRDEWRRRHGSDYSDGAATGAEKNDEIQRARQYMRRTDERAMHDEWRKEQGLEDDESVADATKTEPDKTGTASHERGGSNNGAQQVDFQSPKDYNPFESNMATESVIADAAADLSVHNSNIAAVDSIMYKATGMAKEKNISMYEALKEVTKGVNPDDDDYASVDAMNNFILTSAAYTMSGEESENVGLAKALLVENAMLADAYADSKEGERLKQDNELIKPIVEDYLKNNVSNDPNAFRDYLQDTLDTLKANDSKARNFIILSDGHIALKHDPAINSLVNAIKRVDDMSSWHQENLKSLQDNFRYHNGEKPN